MNRCPTSSCPYFQIDPPHDSEFRICHHVIVNESGRAVYANQCCVEDQLTGLPVCSLVDSDGEGWLKLLRAGLVLVRVIAFIFSPLLFRAAVASTVSER